ncbi:hypothetical protein MMC12_004078 [Toensbergia leucococca]|nr:hypothetical protein [Toensbergia leucococca]
MEFLDGRIFEDASFPGVTVDERSRMWYDAIRTLAKFHRVDFKSIGLSNYGKSSGFYNRQIKTLGTISGSQAQAVDIETHIPVGKIPHFDDMVAFFRNSAAQPVDQATLIHGDYKIDNLNAAFSASSLATGLPTRPQCIDWYAGIAGWDPRADLGWGDAFGVFRNSVIMQGIAARYAMRQASSAKAKEYAVEMVPFGNFAWVLVEALMRKRENEMKAKL